MLGNNANIYMTQMVTEPKLLQQLQQLRPGLVRFPGGNLSSIFFWNAALVIPRQTPLRSLLTPMV